MKGFILGLLLTGWLVVPAQKATFFSTGAGLLVPLGNSNLVFDPSVSFQSGLEFRLPKSMILQGNLQLNAVRYKQRFPEAGELNRLLGASAGLFQLGLHVGRFIPLSKRDSVWSISPYVGLGAMMLGEPRVTQPQPDTWQYRTVRSLGAYGVAGARIACRTHSRFLQVVYLDAQYWHGSVLVQGVRPQAVGFYMGMLTQF